MSPARLFDGIRDRRGISSVEFALVAMVFFLFVLGVIDFSRALWEWNAAAKATQIGVRYAVVNDTVSTQFANFGATGLSAGDPVPVGTPGTETVVCRSNTGCNGDLNAMNATAFNNIVDRMNAIYDRILAKNVVITYEHIGLGTAGTPIGPDVDPLVTIHLEDMDFQFTGISFLISSIAMPDFAASLTAEDQRTD